MAAACYCDFMTKKLPAKPKSHTHFDQIPIAVVKKTVPMVEAPGKRPARTGSSSVEPTSRKTAAAVEGGHFHGVQFYNDADTLCRIVGGFIGEGLDQGTLAVIIATPEHAAQIESCLQRQGKDVEALKRLGHLAVFDARETLELFMRDGLPNPGAFRRSIGEVLAAARQGREQRAIRAYGEMVNLLWKDGLEAAAIRLETLWNQLAGTHDFELLCGYSMGHFYKGSALDDIKGQHSHVVSDDGDASALRAAM